MRIPPHVDATRSNARTRAREMRAISTDAMSRVARARVARARRESVGKMSNGRAWARRSRARVDALDRDARAGGRRCVLTRANVPEIPGIPDAERLMAKYAGDAAREATRGVARVARNVASGGRSRAREYDGVFSLLFINFLLFALDHWGGVAAVKSLYLNHARPAWWQFVTSTFCHANWAHLSSNIFFLYIFGKLVEEEEGTFGVWMSYVVTGVGANVASWLLLPKSVGGVLGIGGAATVSLGASGAVFGLFAVSVLVKLKFNWRRILEVIILGQFVVERFLSEAKMMAAAGSGVGAGNVNHIAHLGGAIAGVLLIFFLTRLVPP